MADCDIDLELTLDERLAQLPLFVSTPDSDPEIDSLDQFARALERVQARVNTCQEPDEEDLVYIRNHHILEPVKIQPLDEELQAAGYETHPKKKQSHIRRPPMLVRSDVMTRAMKREYFERLAAEEERHPLRATCRMCQKSYMRPHLQYRGRVCPACHSRMMNKKRH